MTARAPSPSSFTAIVLVALCLSGCGGQVTNTRLTLPPLPGSASLPCGPLMQLGDGEIPTLKDRNEYHQAKLAECEIRRRAAVEAYEKARTANNEAGR